MLHKPDISHVIDSYYNWELGFSDKEAMLSMIETSLIGDNTDTQIEKLSMWFVEHIDRARDGAMLSLSDLGAGVLGKTADLTVTNPPDLYFETLKQCHTIFLKLAFTPNYLRSGALAPDFSGIGISDCYSGRQFELSSDKRWEQHLKFLVLGAVFASVEKWSVADEHAQRAISIIERAKNLGASGSISTKEGLNSNPSGREAYFLRSVCSRVRARSIEELNKSVIFLKSAEKAFAKDLKEKSDHGLKKTRFYNEAVSISLAKYYQTRMESESEHGADIVADVKFEAIHPCLADIYDRMKTL